MLHWSVECFRLEIGVIWESRSGGWVLTGTVAFSLSVLCMLLVWPAVCISLEDLQQLKYKAKFQLAHRLCLVCTYTCTVTLQVQSIVQYTTTLNTPHSVVRDMSDCGLSDLNYRKKLLSFAWCWHCNHITCLAASETDRLPSLSWIVRSWVHPYSLLLWFSQHIPVLASESNSIAFSTTCQLRNSTKIWHNH